MNIRAFASLVVWAAFAFATFLGKQPETRSAASLFVPPTVELDGILVTGKYSEQEKLAEFLGIPYAQPPTGTQRFRLPQPLLPYEANFSATSFGPACPQQVIQLEPIIGGLPSEAKNFIVDSVYTNISPDSEDCLHVNVVKPADATPDSNLPVTVWIFGSGFEYMSPNFAFLGNDIVRRSVDIKKPIIYVSMNHRLAGFGFLASKEVKAAGVGNLGLQDQREALRWVQKYIRAFGGDPGKVTLSGVSAGAMSVSLHMLANDGNNEGLFRAGIMHSGGPIPVGDITLGQKYYDAVVIDTGCSSGSDTLGCLRTVPYNTLKDAINRTPGAYSYQSMNLAWYPRADGVFLTDNPQKLVQAGKVANVPFITSSCDDEGTMFSLTSLNITQTEELREYLKTVLLPPDIPDSDIDRILELYPQDPAEGSPFNTSILNAITPQYKRIAALVGDAVFQGPRRFFLNQRWDKQDTWTYLNKRFKFLPVLGSVHASDTLPDPIPPPGLYDYLIRFITNLDPNDPIAKLQWPKYTTSTRQMLTFYDSPLTPQGISIDDYRLEPMEFLTNVTLSHPF